MMDEKPPLSGDIFTMVYEALRVKLFPSMVKNHVRSVWNYIQAPRVKYRKVVK